MGATSVARGDGDDVDNGDASRKKSRNWTTKEAKIVLHWARSSNEERPSIQEFAARFERSPAAVQEFLRRSLPRGERPWTEKPRWAADEIEALQRDAAKVPTRSLAAIRKYIKRHAPKTVGDSPLNEEVDRSALTVTQVAQDLGLSRASVYRLVKSGVLRRFKGRIAETSFSDLLREHPEVIPYSRLRRDQKEWLVLNGYFDPSLMVKRPSTKGILD